MFNPKKPSTLYPGIAMLFFFISLSFQSVAQKNDTVTQKDEVDIFVDRVMEDRLISGLQLAVIQHGEIIKLKSYGFANLEHQVPVNDRTIFPLNSITKAFTGVALMTLVEEGRLDLSDKISLYLQDIPEQWANITIRQLATHTAGLPYIMDPRNEGNYLSQSVGDDGWLDVMNKPMLFSPGEKFDYNQLGYALLGLTIEKITGDSFQEYIEEHQFKAADMESSSFGDFHEVIPHKAQSYTAYNGTYYNIYEAIPEHLFPATGVNSTAEEVSKWVIAIQKNEILKKERNFEALYQPLFLKDGTLAGFEGIVNGYGIGWPFVKREHYPAMAAIGGGRSAVFIYPEDDLAVIILTNRRGCAPEQFVDEIAGYYIPALKASNGFGFPPEFKVLNANILNGHPDSAILAYQKIKSENANFTLPEELLNSWAYKILRSGDLLKALAIFKLNVLLYSKSANTYDSYAEALLLHGDIKKARKNYRKSLELNPNNKNAAQQLRNLQF